MSKIAIVTDSNSGITQTDAAKLGVHVLPMPFTIDGATFYEDINLTQSEFYEKLMNNAEVFTSQPTVGEVTKLWDAVLQDYDEIVHIPMSSSLSGSYQTAVLLAQEYDGKVQVVDSQRVSLAQKWDAVEAVELAQQGKNSREIKEILEGSSRNHSIFITVNTLEYLAKGGRITPAAALLGNMLKIKPILVLKRGKLDTYSKTRTLKKGAKIMKEAIRQIIDEQFDGDLSKVHIDVAYAYDRELALQVQADLEAEFHQEIEFVDPLSLSVSCHVGPHAIAICVCNRL